MPKHLFEYHVPTPEMAQQITQVRGACKALYEVLLSLPPCRERLVAITKLEEAAMWANKGIVFQEEATPHVTERSA